MAPDARYDLIFADTWPGKYRLLEKTLTHLARGGLYIVDDMLPQPNWPPGHAASVRSLYDSLRARADLAITELDWSTGLILAAKRTAA